MNVKKLITSMTSLIFVLGILLFPTPPNAYAESSKITLTLSAPGVALEQPSTLLVAVRLSNSSDRTAFNVKINSIRLDSAPLLTSTPLRLGRLKAGQAVVVQADFNSETLVQGKEYELVIRGTYRTAQGNGDDDREDDASERKRHAFVLRSVIILPLPSPGSAVLDTVTVPSDRVSGAPFPHQERDPGHRVNPAGPPIPTGPFVPGTPTATSTVVQSAPIAQTAVAEAAGPIIFLANNSLGLTSGSTNGTASTVAEPSGATGGGVVFAAANWTAAYSTDGGVTFTQLDPTTIFPSTGVGFCCDQIVQYVPSIDRFIWLMQGNGMRIASASPADVISSGGTAWTFWDLTPNIFGALAGTGFDYPDLSVGNNSLYISWNAGFPCPAGCNWGHQVVRTSLVGIQTGGTITIEFTDPANSRTAWGAHLMQNTLDEIFWAGHATNSRLTVWSLQEGSNIYFWRDVGISSWANNALSSTTPDGLNWLTGSNGFPDKAILGATRSGNQLWFAWTAGTDNNFQQAHVEMVTLDRNNNFSVVQQVQIWNPDYAFGYPALATNACTREVGLSFEFGGGGNYQNHVVGFWGDFIAYITTGSNVGTTRFGDYVTIRQEPAGPTNRGNLFNAFGYGLNSVPPPGTGTNTDIHYVLFGRPASLCSGPD